MNLVCWVLTDIMMIITIETTIEDVKIHFIMDVISIMAILMEIIVIAIGIINQNQDIQTLGITGKVEQGYIRNIGGG